MISLSLSLHIHIYIYIYIYVYIQSTDTCFVVPQLISVAWYNLGMAWQLFISKRLSVTTACGTMAVVHTSRERKAIWGQSAQTTTRVVHGFALLLKDTHTNFTERSTTPKWRSVIYIHVCVRLSIYISLYIYRYIYIYIYMLWGLRMLRILPSSNFFLFYIDLPIDCLCIFSPLQQWIWE